MALLGDLMGMNTVRGKLALASAALGFCFAAGAAMAADLSSGGDGGFKDAPAPTYFTDDVISYRYSTFFREPGVNGGQDIEKNILNFQHINTDKYGSNFLDIDMLFSSGQDPVNGVGPNGATEVYAVYRRYWSYSGITGTDVSNGIIKDFGLRMGGDVNTKNDAFSAEKRLVVVGPQVYLNVPVGFFFVSANFTHEWNHNGLGFCHCSEDFSPALDIEAAWLFPFTVGDSKLTFKGFFNYVAPKGKGAAPESERVYEILTRPELLLDVGNYFGKPNKLEAGVGYEFWLNKFGNNPALLDGTVANTPELIVRYHF
jgi:hypothetical protein